MSCGCFTNKLPKEPKTQTSEYIEDLSGSVAVHLKETEVGTRFSWLVKLRKPLPKNAYIEAEFPDINEKNAPFKVPVSKLAGKEEAENQYFVLSPEIQTKCGLTDVKMTIYKDQTRQEVLSIHKSKILSRIDSSNCTLELFKKMMNNIQK